MFFLLFGINPPTPLPDCVQIFCFKEYTSSLGMLLLSCLRKSESYSLVFLLLFANSFIKYIVCSLTVSCHISGVSPGISSSEASAQARRSQRQQDRIKLQEAGRILAENQEMLQREKELYGKGPTSTSTNTSTSPPAALQPATEILPSLAPVVKPLITTPVSSKGKGKAEPSEEDSNR